MDDFITLFGFPIFKTSIDPNSYNKKNILDTIYNNYNKDNSRNIHWEESDLHHSYSDENNPEFETPDYSELGKLYVPIINRYLKQFPGDNKHKYQLEFVNYTAMSKGQSVQKHNHIGSDFSIIHYLKFNEGHKETVYYNGHSATKYPSLLDRLTNTFDNNAVINSYFMESYKINVKEDDLVISPSMLEHSVPPQEIDNLRMAVVANIKLILPGEDNESMASE